MPVPACLCLPRAGWCVPAGPWRQTARLSGAHHTSTTPFLSPAHPSLRPLSAEDKALLWRFRFALTPLPRALTKFLKCVDWSDASEARQAAELMASWAPIGVADALELLSPDFVNEEVRG